MNNSKIIYNDKSKELLIVESLQTLDNCITYFDKMRNNIINIYNLTLSHTFREECSAKIINLNVIIDTLVYYKNNILNYYNPASISKYRVSEYKYIYRYHDKEEFEYYSKIYNDKNHPKYKDIIDTQLYYDYDLGIHNKYFIIDTRRDEFRYLAIYDIYGNKFIRHLDSDDEARMLINYDKNDIDIIDYEDRLLKYNPSFKNYIDIKIIKNLANIKEDENILNYIQNIVDKLDIKDFNKYMSNEFKNIFFGRIEYIEIVLDIILD